MRHLFSQPLGATSAPFGSPKKEIFNLLSSIVTGAMNSGNVSATNEMNYFMNAATNKANQQINESQLEWARQQYEDEKAENRFLVDQAYERELENREYNSLENQRKRAIEAGFNPNFILGNSGGSSGNLSVAVGSAPRANLPNMIPMQNASPMQAYQMPPGLGINEDLQNYFLSKQDERSDYALASNIQAENMNAYANMIRAFSQAKKDGVDIEFMRDSMQRAWKSLFLEQDKFAAENEWRSVTNNIQERQLKEQQYANQTQRLAAESGVMLDVRQAKYLNTLISSVKRHDDLDASETAQRVISMINNDAAIFETLGLSKDMSTSQKFKNYVSSVTEMIGAGLAAYTGARMGMKKAVPLRPNNYLDDFYKPW